MQLLDSLLKSLVEKEDETMTGTNKALWMSLKDLEENQNRMLFLQTLFEIGQAIPRKTTLLYGLISLSLMCFTPLTD